MNGSRLAAGRSQLVSLNCLFLSVKDGPYDVFRHRPSPG